MPVRSTRYFAAFLLLAAAVAPAVAQVPGQAIGRVIDAANGRPIAGARVDVDAGGAHTESDADGRFDTLAASGNVDARHGDRSAVRRMDHARVFLSLRPERRARQVPQPRVEGTPPRSTSNETSIIDC